MALIQTNFYSECLCRTVSFDAVIPVDSPAEMQNPPLAAYPTLYLLHGLTGSCNDWLTRSRIALWAQQQNLAVILPSGENKFYVDNFTSGEWFGKFIGQELVEFTRRLFPLSHKREETFIAGLSMGGYGAIINGLRFSETFGYIAGLSSALILDRVREQKGADEVAIKNRMNYSYLFGELGKLPETDRDYRALALKIKEENRPIPKMYLCCGTEDSLISANRDYRDFLLGHGFPLTYEEGPGGHEWDFWDRYIKRILDWLPTKKETLG